LTIPAFWYAGKPIQLPVTSIIAASWKYVLASIIAGSACPVIIQMLLPVVPVSGVIEAASHILVTSLLFGTLYVGAIILLHQGCEPLYQIASLLREMVPWETFQLQPSSLSNPETAESETLVGSLRD
jgi:hypothetical protein